MVLCRDTPLKSGPNGDQNVDGFHVRSFDYLRIIACFFVIMNHTVNWYYFDFRRTPGWFLSSVLFIICKIAVPVFFMISGALLLKNPVSYKKCFLKAGKMLRILVIWTVISFFAGNGFSITGKELFFLLRNFFYMEPVSTHFWYLYTLIGIYMMLPFLQHMIRSFNQKDYLIWLGLWIAFNSVLKLFNSLVMQREFSYLFQVQMFTGWFGYLILGDYIYQTGGSITNGTKKRVIWLVVLLADICFSIILVIRSGDPMLIDSAAYPMTIVLAIFSFSIAVNAEPRLRCREAGNAMDMVISGVSKRTMGIYLMHTIFIYEVFHFFPGIVTYLTRLGWILVFDVIVFVSCLVFTFVLEKIPVVRRVLF